MPEDAIIMFIIGGGSNRCAECGEGFVEDDPKGVPYIFDIECPVHHTPEGQVMFHENCLPDEYRRAYEEHEKRRKAPLN